MNFDKKKNGAFTITTYSKRQKSIWNSSVEKMDERQIVLFVNYTERENGEKEKYKLKRGK